MKIGAGGLQSQVTQDWAPVSKGTTEQQKLHDEVLAQEASNYQGSVNRKDLAKAVDKLNGAAELFNHPYRFSLNEKGDAVKVETNDGKSSRVLKEMPAKQALGLSQRMGQAVGVVLDEHV